MRLSDFVAKLPDPDSVGTSEYRLLHDHLSDLASSFEHDGMSGRDALSAAINSLGELEEDLRSLLSDLRAARGA